MSPEGFQEGVSQQVLFDRYVDKLQYIEEGSRAVLKTMFEEGRPGWLLCKIGHADVPPIEISRELLADAAQLALVLSKLSIAHPEEAVGSFTFHPGQPQ